MHWSRTNRDLSKQTLLICNFHLKHTHRQTHYTAPSDDIRRGASFEIIQIPLERGWLAYSAPHLQRLVPVISLLFEDQQVVQTVRALQLVMKSQHPSDCLLRACTEHIARHLPAEGRTIISGSLEETQRVYSVYSLNLKQSNW